MNKNRHDEKLLARLVREAGDPSVSPDPHHTESLRTMLLDHLDPTAPADEVAERIGVEKAIPLIEKRSQTMKRIIKLAIAATILVALGIFTSWTVIDRGSSNLAFAEVAKALDNLPCATFEIKMEGKMVEDQPKITMTGKGSYLAPSLQRMEISVKMAGMPENGVGDSIMVIDQKAAKCLMLMPTLKCGMIMDTKKMREEMKKPGKFNPDMFEQVRQLVREGSLQSGDQVKNLGEKEIDGHTAVGFQVHSPNMDMTLWADPETARPVLIEASLDAFDDFKMVMDEFRYDVDLDPAWFSLEPPKGYTVQTMNLEMPTEKDLLRTLRIIAKHNKEKFPSQLKSNKEVLMALGAAIQPEMEKLLAKFPNYKPKPGEQPPAEMMAETMKTITPIQQKNMQGILFYMQLKPENDAHYTGGGVKLGTPSQPIFWYKPTDSNNYHVIYADLSVKTMTPEEIKKLPEASTEKVL